MNSPHKGNRYMLVLLFAQIATAMVFYFLPDRLSITSSLIISEALFFGVPFILYLLITRRSVSQVLPLRRLSFRNTGLIILMMISIQPLMMFLSSLSSIVFPNNISNVFSEMGGINIATAMLAMSVTPAIFEEITFRGVILSNYKGVPIKKAALINGLFFAFIHLDLQQFLYAFVLGVIFVYLVHYTRSIFAPILAHFIINGSQTLLAFSMDLEAAAESAELTLNQRLEGVVATLVLTGIFLPVFWLLYKSFKRHNIQENLREDIYSTEPLPEETKQSPFGVSLWLVVVIYIAIIGMVLFATP